jgi:hypothetical protein
MRHLIVISRRRPVPALYYQVSLTQKIMELATLASFADSFLGVIKGVVNPQE